MDRGICKIVSLFGNLTSILDEADWRIIEEEEGLFADEGVEPIQDAGDLTCM